MKKKTNKKLDIAFQIYGLNGAENVLKAKKLKVLTIDLMKESPADRRNVIRYLLKKSGGKIHSLPKNVFLKKYQNRRTQGIVVNFTGNVVRSLPDLKNSHPSFCLIAADNLEDPQNMGQIIRTSECAGIDGILLPEHHSVQATNTVIQVSQGAFVHLSLYQCGNLRQQLINLKKQGFWIIGVENSIKAKIWYKQDLTGKTVLVFGSEGKGIRPIILKECDDLITIPMKGKVNSLNVSAAVSAILFDRLRQIYISKIIPKTGMS